MVNEGQPASHQPFARASAGLAVIAVGVLGYLYYQEKREIVRIDFPGFSGSVKKKPGGFSGKIGKDKEIDVPVD